MMAKYRKKPVVIEARELTADTLLEVAMWSNAKGQVLNDGAIEFIIPTYEGPIYAKLGDYIIKGVDGGFYSCKPHVFAASYEPVT